MDRRVRRHALVLLPGRDEGHNLRSTSLAIGPGADDLYVSTSDGTGGQGATIFHAKAFAKALPLYSHQWRTYPARLPLRRRGDPPHAAQHRLGLRAFSVPLRLRPLEGREPVGLGLDRQPPLDLGRHVRFQL